MKPQPDHDLAPQSAQRWLALDVFRALAVLSMIQGHTFTALLRADEYAGAWSSWHSLLHGLTAPMFLLGGGLAYGIVTLRPDRPRPGAGRLVRRGFELLAIGYALQLPKAPLAEVYASHALLSAAVRVGPLQLVGVCLLLCETLRAAIRTRARHVAALAAVLLSVIASAPFVWQARFSDRAPLPLATWLDGYATSLFPFFPWAAFFLLGVIVAPAALRGWAGNDAALRAGLARRLLATGLATAATTYALFLTGNQLRAFYGDHDFWHTSPLYVLFRSGIVLAWLGTLCLLEPAVQRLFRSASWLERLLGALSRHSLVAYVAHLLVLYGTPVTIGLKFLGPSLDKLSASAISLYLIIFTTAIAVLFQHFVASGALARGLSSTLVRMRAGRTGHKAADRVESY